MSLSIDGFWKAGFWAETFWADGFWQEGYIPPVLVIGNHVTNDVILIKKRLDDRH